MPRSLGQAQVCRWCRSATHLRQCWHKRVLFCHAHLWILLAVRSRRLMEGESRREPDWRPLEKGMAPRSALRRTLDSAD